MNGVTFTQLPDTGGERIVLISGTLSDRPDHDAIIAKASLISQQTASSILVVEGPIDEVTA